MGIWRIWHLIHLPYRIVLLLLVTIVCTLHVINQPPPVEESPMDGMPDLEIFVRTFNGKRRFYDTVLTKSLSLFWPRSMLKIVAVLDNERPEDHEWATEISNEYPYPRVVYEDPSIYYHDFGHTRQQYTVFHADKYTDAEYVGFVDTDTFFVTPVTPDILFEDGKPIVIGGIGEEDLDFWKPIPENTAEWFNSTEVMKCMTYFPVIIKRKHIILLRQLVEDIHNREFDDVFMNLTQTPMFCTFNVMCQYIWHHHRDEYSFHIHPYPHPQYREENVPAGRVPFKYYINHVTPEQWLPMPRSSLHWHYPSRIPATPVKMPKSQEQNILNEAFCHSIGFRFCKHKCSNFTENTIQESLYMFEGTFWTWHPLVLQRQQEHYERVHVLLDYLNRTNQAVFGAASIEEACRKWPKDYNLTHYLDLTVIDEQTAIP